MYPPDNKKCPIGSLHVIGKQKDKQAAGKVEQNTGADPEQRLAFQMLDL